MTPAPSRRRSGLHRRAACCALVLGAVLVGGARAQVPDPVPAPRPGTVDMLSAAYATRLAPAAQAFARASAELTGAVARWCEGEAAQGAAGLEAARAQWLRTTAAWDRLAGVAVGPLVKRRALTALDFNPTRPATIERAIKAAPSGPEAMERIGTPAKGLPALEWLLWTHAPQPGSPGCRYTREVAADLQREAGAIAADFAQQAATPWADDRTKTYLALQELINQWLGGVERLRWTQIDKPLKAAETGSRPPAFQRAASGATGATWAGQWEALRGLGGPVADALRARGQGPLAERLGRTLAQADAAMAKADPAQPATLAPAVRELGALKKLIEADVAPALDVTIGFSDGDGD